MMSLQGHCNDIFFCFFGRVEQMAYSVKRKNKPEQRGLCSDVVPEAGVEPARYRYHWILSPARLPIPSFRQKFYEKSTERVRQAGPLYGNFARSNKKWSYRPESNRRPVHYE